MHRHAIRGAKGGHLQRPDAGVAEHYPDIILIVADG